MADDGLVAGEIDPDEARGAAEEILDRPEYREPEPGLVERVFGWIGDQIGNLFEALAGGGPGGVIGWVVVGAVVLAAAWLLRRALVLPGHRTGEAPVTVQYGTTQRRPADSWLAEAERQRSAGDLRQALRCRYQALVVELTDGGILDATPGRTTGEHRDELLRTLPGDAAVVDRTTATFERTWFGGAEVSADDYRAFVADTERLTAASARARASVGAGR